MESTSINDVANQLFKHLMTIDPLGATLMGDRSYDNELARLNREKETEFKQQRALIRESAELIDVSSLTEQELSLIHI